MAQYSFDTDHFLDAAELGELRAKHLPSLVALNARYCPHIDVESYFPVTPIYVDFLRTQWRLDGALDRPSEDLAISGLGYAFGLLLASCTELRWCIANDAEGEFLTMGRSGAEYSAVSVPPFSYVAKRQTTENAEIFLHFFEQVPADVTGFVQPENWLLDE
jgi:hypothetical protein